MLRFIQVVSNKPIHIMEADGAIDRGEAVSIDLATGKAAPIGSTATAAEYIADAPKNYDGINAIVMPTDDTGDSIASGGNVLVIPTYIGERYATDQVTATGLVAGDKVTAKGGKFVEATSAESYNYIYVGTYSDPVGTLHIIERVANATA